MNQHAWITFVTLALEHEAEFLFPSRPHTDLTGFADDDRVANAAGELLDHRVHTFRTQRGADGRVSTYAVMMDAPDDVTARLLHRLLPSARRRRSDD